MTRDVSSEGFYCLSSERFVPGERVACSISIPVPSASNDQSRQLHCHCTVLRTERTDAGLFGYACQIDDFSLSVEDIA